MQQSDRPIAAPVTPSLDAHPIKGAARRQNLCSTPLKKADDLVTANLTGTALSSSVKEIGIVGMSPGYFTATLFIPDKRAGRWTCRCHWFTVNKGGPALKHGSPG